MFYSQFILAKKGPLGTIWIAAHLERKLRKNQVADTDIGVSVDSILSPEVPIALRLSSHLLLGVVRIYSRKVNYLFDECSEALLKIKQAFRSTAVDLPPEETTAPYHSITLPETFDLDDFELADSDIFQGSYVDHHVSTREQITLQDTMESLVYSTTQFGLDERFGDGDASGLELDEELFLNKVAAPGLAGAMMGSNAEPYVSVQPMTPLEEGKHHEGLNGNSEGVVATVGVNRLEDLVGNADLVGYPHAPGTPGLMEEPNLSKHEEASACDDHLELGEEQNFPLVHEASASDDHLESEYQNSTKFVDKENLANVTSNSGYHFGNGNAGDLSLPSDISPVAFLGGQEIKQLKSLRDSPSAAGKLLLDEPIKTITPVPEFPHTNFSVFDDSNRVEDLQIEVASNNVAGSQFIDCAPADGMEPQGDGLHETVSSPSFSHEGHGLEGSFGISCNAVTNISEQSRLSSTCQPSSECSLETSEASRSPERSYNVENAGNMENSCSPSYEVAPNAGPHGNPETHTCQDPKDSIVLSPVIHEAVTAADMHVLQPCTHMNQQETSGRKEAPCAPGTSTEVPGEGSHVDFTEPVLEDNHTTEPASCEDIQADFCKLNNQVPNMISGDTQLEKLDGLQNSELPAPEKLLSVPEVLADVQDNLLVESTPFKAHLTTGDGGDAEIINISGKKRSFGESTLTMESLNSVESLGVAQSNITHDSVPDDNDLLSSILVGRRSSVLKLKPTPTLASEITCMKRPRSAPRISASKRKVLVDDTMVLHGDVIRQQLTSTEDIRRIRKKAPCTRPEIWLIQKELWEDEIFSEPIFTGLSTELILWQGQTYDLSEITVSKNDAPFSFLEAAVDPNFVSKKDENSPLETENEMDLSMEPNVHRKTGTINESMVVRKDGEAEPSGNQQGEEHILLSPVYGTTVQMEATCDPQEPQSLPHEHSREITEIEIDGASVRVANAVNPPVYMVSSTMLDEENGGDGVLQMDGSGLPLDQRLVSQSVDVDASIVCLSSGKGVDDMEVEEESDIIAAVGRNKSTARDEFLLEETDGATSFAIGADLQMPYSAHSETENGSLVISPEAVSCSNQFLVTIDQTMEESMIYEERAVNEDEVVAAELGLDVKNITDSNGELKESSSCSVDHLNVDSKNACSNDGKYPGFQEAGLQCTMHAEVAVVGEAATEDHGDFDCTLDGHDTGFLNVDDDDVAEEDDDYVPNAEQTSFLENSGWSSRTRAVAKYLQVLFVKEAEHGRKVLPLDSLLAGKTRKEASRMFFEALVLKTRDYIHVEQGAPFDNINVKPRMKLTKSDF